MTCYGSTGREWYVYRNTGSYDTPVWTLVDIAKDVTITLNKDEIESRRRGASWIEYLKGQKEMTLDIPCKWVKGNTNLQAFQQDYFADDCAYHDLLILDDEATTTGAEGVRAIVALFDFTMNLGLADEATVDLSFRPTYVEEPAGTPVGSEWFTVA